MRQILPRPLRRALLLTALPVGLAACSEDGGTTPPGAVASIELEPASPDTLFALEDTLHLSAVARDASGATIATAAVTYTSSDNGVATVSSSGAVASKENGSATITATSGSVSDAVTVRVRQKLATVQVTPATPRIGVGHSATLTVTPADARGHAVELSGVPTFMSGNTAVATVDDEGVVTGTGAGSTEISATVTSPQDGARSGSTQVTVAVVEAAATVAMGAATFSPSVVDISRGGSVTFMNGSGIAHDVDFGIAALNIGVHSSGQTIRTFADPGTFDYHCNLHAGMAGTVHVH